MKKFKAFADFSEEEQYLNDMANKGYIFKKYSLFGFYHFFNGEKQDLKYRVDYRTFKKKRDFEDYKVMFEDFGWEHIFGTKNSRKQYFLPKNKSPNQEIFSNEESATSRYKRFYEICSVNLVVAFIYFSAIFVSYDFKLSSFWFLTPGLWERSGFELFRGILLELPFVALRILGLMFFIIVGLFYGILAYKIKKLYKEKTN